MSGYIEIARVEEIPKNGMKRVSFGGLEILLVNADGKFYAVENQCPHKGYSLYLGTLEGEVLTCGFHYAKFNITTGKSLEAATHKPLKTYKVKIQNSSILVEV